MAQYISQALVCYVFGLRNESDGFLGSSVLYGYLVVHGLQVKVDLLAFWTEHGDICTAFNDEIHIIAKFTLTHCVMTLWHKLVFHLLCDKAIVILTAITVFHERHLVLHVVL